jgi:N-acetylmuramoyl-L-alanine amidase
MAENNSNRPKSSTGEGIIDALSHAIAGASGKSLVFVITLAVISGVGWGIQYFLKKTEKMSAILVTLDQPQDEGYLFELDGHTSHSSKTGRVRFDNVRPGVHYLAVFTGDILMSSIEVQVEGGEELLISKNELSALDTSSTPEITYEKSHEVAPKVDIVIDAGHGGADPGAFSEIEGIIIKEKFITLDAAKSLKEILELKGYSVFLTRRTDSYISLRSRVKEANIRCKKLFLSLHADAFRDTEVRGFSVFRLSESGMRSEIARMQSDSIPEDRDNLADKVFEKNIRLSGFVGESILDEVSSTTPLYKDTVQKAGFVVLKSPACPSLLVELGFITNAKDKIALISPEHRLKLYESIANGVESALGAFN